MPKFISDFRELARQWRPPRIAWGWAMALWAAVAMVAPAAGTAWAQGFSSGESTLAGTIFDTQPQLFPDDGRIKVLVVALNPFGLTESAAEQIGLILQKNLSNSGHFAVVGHRETNAVFERERPDLVDCREIACGVESGKRIGADQVLVGTITMDGDTFVLSVRLIDTLNNITDHEEEIRFTDTTMDEVLFRLSTNISRNSLLTGRVLSTSIRGIVLSLGRKDGIKIGDNLVVYRQDVPIVNIEGENIDIQKKTIAIVKVLNVNRSSAEAIISLSTEQPQVTHFAQTYLNPARQIELVENTRRELDTGIRLENKIRPLALAPVLLADNEKRKWREQLGLAQAGRRFWMTVGFIAGGAALYFLNDFENTDFDRLRTVAAIGTAGYSLRRFIQFREEINDLNVEGRAKGFVSTFDLAPLVGPELVGLSLDWRF